MMAAETPSRVRQAKEIAGQKQRDADAARAEVMALVRANWGAWLSAKAQVAAAESQIKAAEKALSGVREEAKAGQRTTIEILNAQLELLNARLTLLTAQRDRVDASYAVLGAVGRLSAERLGLAVEIYDPSLALRAGEGRLGPSEHARRELRAVRPLPRPLLANDLASAHPLRALFISYNLDIWMIRSHSRPCRARANHAARYVPPARGPRAGRRSGRRAGPPHGRAAKHHVRASQHSGARRSGSSERQSRSIIYRADLARLRELTLFLLKDCCGGRPSLRAARRRSRSLLPAKDPAHD